MADFDGYKVVGGMEDPKEVTREELKEALIRGIKKYTKDFGELDSTILNATKGDIIEEKSDYDFHTEFSKSMSSYMKVNQKEAEKWLRKYYPKSGDVVNVVSAQMGTDYKKVLDAVVANKKLAESTEDSETTVIEESKLRSVKVTYGDGTVISTNMAKDLTDEEIKNYFKVGRKFNIGGKFDKKTGDPLDNMQPVKKLVITS